MPLRSHEYRCLTTTVVYLVKLQRNLGYNLLCTIVGETVAAVAYASNVILSVTQRYLLCNLGCNLRCNYVASVN